MHFPDLLNMTKAPSWIPDKVWLKEVNLWMSSGGTGGRERRAQGSPALLGTSL